MKNKTTRFSIPHQFSNSKTAAHTSCNPFYFIPISEKTYKLCPTLINSDNYEISSTKCDTSRIYQDVDIASIPTPYRFNRHPSPFTFASETFEPLFSHFSGTNTTAYLQLQASPTSLKPCQAIIQFPTDLTYHFPPNRQIAHLIPSIMCPSSSITMTLIQGQTPMLPSYSITLMQLYRYYKRTNDQATLTRMR
jgi:hypothetical protein